MSQNKKSILIISQNEICYNPRLLKAADFFLKKKCEVDVINGVTGAAKDDIYKRIKESRPWNIYENQIHKRTTKAYLKWLMVSLLHKLIFCLYKKIGLKLLYPYILNKGLLLYPGINLKKYDIILINLVDSLPLAVKYKGKLHHNPLLIYDSQEFFIGQYQKYEKVKYNWVKETELKYIRHADIILTTTSVMETRMKKEYPENTTFYRVRNVPAKKHTINIENETSGCLFIIWHGMSINYGNCRGVHVIVKALAKCKSQVKLVLQGHIKENDYTKLYEEASRLNIWHNITIKPPADPECIIESIIGYDIGVTGELPEEENQLLTSSNKLFDYIHAGLCTLVPDLPGLEETINEYNTGIIYKSGDENHLASLLDELNNNRDKLLYYKSKSKEASEKLLWHLDYEPVWSKCQDILNNYLN